MRVAIGAGLALLLAGCGGGATVTSNTSSTTTIASSREPASDAQMSDPTTASGGSNNCAKNPDFAPVYAGGKIRVCSSVHFGNTGKDNGSFSYSTDAAPAAVLAWSKEAATRSGLTQRMSTEKMFSAGQGDKTLMVMALPEGSGSKVTVNWGYRP